VFSLFTSGYSSCAGTTGPLFAPLTITPRQVLLRSAIEAREEALALARVDGGEREDGFTSSIEYGKDATAAWLEVEVAGRNLTLRATPGGLNPGVYVATVTVEDPDSGSAGLLRVEYSVVER
jgi:hypothetical protein